MFSWIFHSKPSSYGGSPWERDQEIRQQFKARGRGRGKGEGRGRGRGGQSAGPEKRAGGGGDKAAERSWWGRVDLVGQKPG